MKQKVVIIDYGVGNTHSVYNALTYLGYNKIKISCNAPDINKADVLILPGVGAFETCISNIKERSLDNILGEEVLIKGKPILGICVGMQLLATYSEENGVHTGLDWIKGSVKKLDLPQGYSVPHVGWNNVYYNEVQPLFTRNNSEKSNFYFDHSYSFNCDEQFIAAYCNYGVKVTAAIQYKNIFGVQFHPEKSQVNGLKLFRSFFTSIQ